ncbi:MAG: hypothetical protein AB8G23_11670 [Myxococcota bacterium]
MPLDPQRTPVLIGLGEVLEREEITSAVELAASAARLAFADAPGLESRIQRLSVVGVSFSPVSKTPASEAAAALGLSGITCETTTPGGNTPQWLMNRACQEIVQGELETTLILGAEATRSMKLADPGSDFLTAAQDGMKGDETAGDPVVGASLHGMVVKPEFQAGLARPADVYPMFESALAAESGAPPEVWRKRLGEMLSRASQVAAKNPLAWFPEALSADAIATPTPDNRITAEPYTKRMNSFANVDMGSALLVTTLAVAKELGLADQCVFPWAGASNADVTPASRPELAGSPAIRAAAGATFAAAGLGIDEMDFIDLYSCFPVAVEIGASEIGLSIDDPRGLTLTGGMSFFGGPGNNYTSHGIAHAARRLREGGRFAYASGNGGLLSKHSVGIYGNAPPEDGFVCPDTSAAQEAINAAGIELVTEVESEATVSAGTVVYGRDGSVAAAPIIATLPDGRRVAAKAEEGMLPDLAGQSLVGERVRLSGASPPVYSR